MNSLPLLFTPSPPCRDADSEKGVVDDTEAVDISIDESIDISMSISLPTMPVFMSFDESESDEDDDVDRLMEAYSSRGDIAMALYEF